MPNYSRSLHRHLGRVLGQPLAERWLRGYARVMSASLRRLTRLFPRPMRTASCGPGSCVHTNMPIDARPLGVCSNADSELPRRIFIHEMDTRLVGWTQFRSVALGASGLSPITSTQPAAPTLGSVVFLEPRAGKRLRMRRPGTRRPHRGSYAIPQTDSHWRMWRENGEGLSIRYSKSPSYPSLLRNAHPWNIGPGS